MKKILGAAVGFALAAGAAFADFPEKPISIIVPWPPGDLEDVLSRMIAEDLPEVLPKVLADLLRSFTEA